MLCLLIGILIGSLGTYYVLSTNYTNEKNRLKREINEKEDELEKLQKQKEETKEESIDITSDDTKKEYNQVLNQKLKPVLMYLNDTRTTYDDSDFTDLEMTNATCYYLKEQDDDSIFEQENNSPVENIQEPEVLPQDIEIQQVNPAPEPEQQEVKPAVFEHIKESEKTAVITNAEEIIPQSIDIAPVKPITINSLQNPEPEIKQEPDFDKILNKEIEHTGNETPVLNAFCKSFHIFVCLLIINTSLSNYFTNSSA